MGTTKTRLFLIWSEYHLFTALSLIADRPDPEYRNVLLHPCKPEGSRIPEQLVLPEGTELIRMHADETALRSFPEVKQTLKNIIALDIDLFVTFFEQKPVSIYIIHALRKRAKICLAPDGNKPYLDWSSAPLLYKIKKTLKRHLWLWKQGLFVTRLYGMSMTYARFRPVKEVWVQNARAYRNRTGKKVVEIDILQSDAALDMVNRAYSFDFNVLGLPAENVIFYANNIYYNNEAYDTEMAVLNELVRRYPDLRMVIKPHPHTPQSQSKAFASLAGAQLTYAKVPAELIIANLRSAVICSFWSAALMIDNPHCHFYWMYPIMKKAGTMELELSIVNPTEHIQTIDAIDQMALPDDLTPNNTNHAIR